MTRIREEEEANFTKFGVGEGVPGPHDHANFQHCGFKNVGLRPPKIAIFGINLPIRIRKNPGGPMQYRQAPWAFFTKLGGGTVSQVRSLTPNFTVVALKMWAYRRRNRQNWYFLV